MFKFLSGIIMELKKSITAITASMSLSLTSVHDLVFFSKIT